MTTTTTVPMRRFEVKDQTGRRYRVTRYVWLENVAEPGEPKLWKEIDAIDMTENGGYVATLSDGKFEIEGTGTLVELAETLFAQSH